MQAWLEQLFRDAELTEEEASVSARAVMKRLRVGAASEALESVTAFADWRYERPRSITEALDPRPEGALARLVSAPQDTLPFLDEESPDQLSVVSLAEVMAVSGVDPVVAMASARLMVALHDGASFYSPLWKACGRLPPINLDVLGTLDWRAALG